MTPTSKEALALEKIRQLDKDYINCKISHTEFILELGEILRNVTKLNTIEELIMIGYLIVWYNGSSKRDEYFYIHDEDELFVAKQYPIKQVFAPIKNGTEFRLVAKVNEEGELELL